MEPMRTLALLGFFCMISNGTIAQTETPAATCVVTLEPVENVAIKIEPALPADGKVARGAVLKVTATAAPGYAFDSGKLLPAGHVGQDVLRSDDTNL